MGRVLVIGSTGNIGRQVVFQLAAAGAQVRALARNPDAADLPSPVQVVHGDLTVPEALGDASTARMRYSLFGRPRRQPSNPL